MPLCQMQSHMMSCDLDDVSVMLVVYPLTSSILFILF